MKLTICSTEIFAAISDILTLTPRPFEIYSTLSLTTFLTSQLHYFELEKEVLTTYLCEAIHYCVDFYCPF